MTAPARLRSAKAHDGRTTRDAIVAAACRLMHVSGYRATSVEDVLRESGVGKGNFYYYFRSKEELGYAILDEIVRDFLERTLEPCFADPTNSPLAQIRCFLDRILEIQRRSNCVGGCPFGNLASELSDMHEGFRSRLDGVFSAWRDRFRQALARAQGSGDVDGRCNVDSTSRFLVASLEGAILMAKLAKDITVMEDCVSEIKRYLEAYETVAAS